MLVTHEDCSIMINGVEGSLLKRLFVYKSLISGQVNFSRQVFCGLIWYPNYYAVVHETLLIDVVCERYLKPLTMGLCFQTLFVLLAQLKMTETSIFSFGKKLQQICFYIDLQ